MEAAVVIFPALEEVRALGEVIVGTTRYYLMEGEGDVLTHLARVKERLRRGGFQGLPLYLLQGPN